MRLFGVMIVVDSIQVKDASGEKVRLSMEAWADGMVGFMPIFKTEEEARKFSPERGIVNLETEQPAAE